MWGGGDTLLLDILASIIPPRGDLLVSQKRHYCTVEIVHVIEAMFTQVHFP